MNARKAVRMLSTPLTLIVLLGLLSAGAWWGYGAVTAAIPTIPPPACVPQPMTELATSSVTVNIFNGGDLRGLAGRVSDKLEVGGFKIDRIGNTEERVLSVIIVGAAVDNPEVQLVASWFTTPEVQADQRPDHSVDVLVGNEFNETSGYAAEPLSILAIPSGEVCLPATETPAATQPDPAAETQPSDHPS